MHIEMTVLAPDMMFSATGSGQGLCIPAQYVSARGRGEMGRLYLEIDGLEKIPAAQFLLNGVLSGYQPVPCSPIRFCDTYAPYAHLVGAACIASASAAPG